MICDEDPLRRRPRESTARRKRQERCVWMARKMTEWPSKRGPITKIMPSDGCIGDTVPWRWESGTISTNLDGIWGMSDGITRSHKTRYTGRASALPADGPLIGRRVVSPVAGGFPVRGHGEERRSRQRATVKERFQQHGPRRCCGGTPACRRGVDAEQTGTTQAAAFCAGGLSH